LYIGGPNVQARGGLQPPSAGDDYEDGDGTLSQQSLVCQERIIVT